MSFMSDVMSGGGEGLKRKRVKIDNDVKFLLEEALKKVGSKRRLAHELGYPLSANKIVNDWLSGKIKTITQYSLERLVEILES